LSNKAYGLGMLYVPELLEKLRLHQKHQVKTLTAIR